MALRPESPVQLVTRALRSSLTNLAAFTAPIISWMQSLSEEVRRGVRGKLRSFRMRIDGGLEPSKCSYLGSKCSALLSRVLGKY
jgi:hypothetical protein